MLSQWLIHNTCLEAIAIVHQQVSKKTEVEVLEAAVKRLKDSLLFFPSPVTPVLWRYTAKSYGYAILNPFVDQCNRLSKHGLELAMLSSNFLEASNINVKFVLR
jgi:hypothetical protein